MKLFLIFLFFLSNFLIAQTHWKSEKYGYTVEIPRGFKIDPNKIGKNVDFKATYKNTAIVIVVKELPDEASNLNIWQIHGDLNDFVNYFESNSKYYFNSLKVQKYGKTKIKDHDAFWFDYTTDNGKYYYKNYMLKKGKYSYTITLSSLKTIWNDYSNVWFRFKNQINI